MKKTKLCAAGLAATMLLSISALAATNLQKQDADLLNELGLLKGAGSGYALDRTLTRVEGGVMLVRLLGGEQEALTKNYTCPFTDVADWAKPYVGWLYHEKLTNGTSATTYVPNRQMTMKEYLWFLGRASGYTDEEIADGKGVVSKASYDAQKDTKINRGQMSALSMDTLYHPIAGSDESFAQQLMKNNTFSQMQWKLVKYDYEQLNHLDSTEKIDGVRWDAEQRIIYKQNTDGTESLYLDCQKQIGEILDPRYIENARCTDAKPKITILSYDGTAMLLRANAYFCEERGTMTDVPFYMSYWEFDYLYQDGKLTCVRYRPLDGFEYNQEMTSQQELLDRCVAYENERLKTLSQD